MRKNFWTGITLLIGLAALATIASGFDGYAAQGMFRVQRPEQFPGTLSDIYIGSQLATMQFTRCQHLPNIDDVRKYVRQYSEESYEAYEERVRVTEREWNTNDRLRAKLCRNSWDISIRFEAQGNTLFLSAFDVKCQKTSKSRLHCQGWDLEDSPLHNRRKYVLTMKKGRIERFELHQVPGKNSETKPGVIAEFRAFD